MAYQDKICDTVEYNRDRECCSEEQAAPLVMRVSVKVVMGRAESFVFLLRVGISGQYGTEHGFLLGCRVSF